MKLMHVFLLSVLLGIVLPASAGGLYLYEIGSTDLGLAGAGSAARSADASTVYSNPAGMTMLEGGHLTAGAQAIYGAFDYTLNKGDSPGNVVGWQPAGSLFYSQEINNNLHLGMGLYSNAGLGLDFGNSWKGQALLEQASLEFITLQPTVAWRLNERWSLGGGLTVTQGRVKINSGNMPGGRELIDQNDTDYAYGARIGMLYQLSAGTRLGLAWSSEQKFHFDIDQSITHPGTGNTLLIENANMILPQQVMASLYHQLNDNWAVMGNVGWQEWSRFADNSVNTSAQTVNSQLKLQDTWHVAAGMQYRLTNAVTLNGGMAYDSSWYKHGAESSFTWPSSQAWRIGSGVQYALSLVSEVGFAMEYLRGSTLKDPAPVLGGEYESPWMMFIAAQYSYRF